MAAYSFETASRTRYRCSWVRRSLCFAALRDTARARRQWEDLRARQSKTFAQAVAEYERRYGRKPPKGFDQWYAFARANNVVLIDEFDLIERDLVPYRALSPQSFRARTQHLIDTVDFSWHIRIGTNGMVTRGGQERDNYRSQGVAEILKPFAHHLPDGLTAVFYAHDGPRGHLGWAERMRLGKIGRDDRFEDDAAEIAKPSTDETRFMPLTPGARGKAAIQQTCPPESALRKIAFSSAKADATGLEVYAPPSGADATFIGSFDGAIDLCANPQYRHAHAAVSFVHAQGPSPLLPLLTPGVHGYFSDIHAALIDGLDMMAAYRAEHATQTLWHQQLRPEVAKAIKAGRIDPDPADADDVQWHDKPFDRVAWRGQTSGLVFSKSTPWRATSVRTRLHLMSKQLDGERSLLVADKRGIVRRTPPIRNKVLNPAFFDTGMVGPPVQCIDSTDDQTCEEMYEVFDDFDSKMSAARAHLYKYVIDVDGNSWSGRFRRLLLSRSMVLKATEFWTDWAIPWLHFVPVQVDYSDLWDVMAFFRGDEHGRHAHDDLAEEIASAGREWASTCFRQADIEAYTFRQFLELGRLWSTDRERASFDGDTRTEPAWRARKD